MSLQSDEQPQALVIGLGRIGLPIALTLADNGVIVYGVDIDHRIVETLSRGITPFNEPGMQELLTKVIDRYFIVLPMNTATLQALSSKVTHVIIAIGINVDESYRIVEENLLELLNMLIKARLIESKTLIIRTTLPLGFSKRIVDYIYEQAHLREGYDYFYVYMPERLMEGRAVIEEKTLPKIVGVYNETAFNRVKQIYRNDKLIKVSPEEAELIKLIDNAWRATIFAFANNIALLAERYGIDAWKVIRIANEDYPRNRIPIPGPVSGYCLTKDPIILEHGGLDTLLSLGIRNIWFYAKLINDYVIDHIVKTTLKILKITGLERGTLLVLGLSYKQDVDDFRNSHSLTYLRKLLSHIDTAKIRVLVHDPYIDTNRYTYIPSDIQSKVNIIETLETGIKDADGLVILTAHSLYQRLLPILLENTEKLKFIIDCWAILRDYLLMVKHRRSNDRDKVFIYYAFGSPLLFL